MHVVRRPTGLPVGTTTADLAAAYASVLPSELGRVDVIGLSTGGLIAQELALGHPDTVDRLALVVTGARIAEPGRRLCAEWVRLARARDWRGVRRAQAAAAVDGRLTRRLARVLVRRSGPPHAPDDLAITVGAALAHDTTERLASLSRPALLVGGADDPFFPARHRQHTHAAAGTARRARRPEGPRRPSAGRARRVLQRLRGRRHLARLRRQPVDRTSARARPGRCPGRARRA